MNGYYNDMDSPWTKDMHRVADQQKSGNPRYAGVIESIRGQPLKPNMTDSQVAWWIRIHDIAENPQWNVMAYAPNGMPLGYVLNADGTHTKFSWNIPDRNRKAIAIFRDPSFANISAKLGTGAKVRQFSNGGLAPNYDGGGDFSRISVAVDTHQVAGGLLLPLGQMRL